MKIIKTCFQWFIAIALGFCIVNLLCLVYERPVGWIETPNGPTPAGWNPQTTLVHGTEGYGINKVDENGYINAEGTLQDSHILCMGSSHTQGKELPSGENYPSLINKHFSKDQESLAAYSVACDANFLPSLIKHFPAAVEAYPNASVVTIEISSTDVSAEELEGALSQVNYDESQSIKNQVEHAGFKDKLKLWIKEYFPLLSLIKSKLETPSATDTVAEESDTTDATPDFEKVLKLIRSQYDGEIIFIYHSQTLIEKDGSVSFADDKLFNAFEKACVENDIQVIDMRPVFTQYYEEHKEIPYGFANTKPGNGHLNKLGHRLVAETLITYIEEVMP